MRLCKKIVPNIQILWLPWCTGVLPEAAVKVRLCDTRPAVARCSLNGLRDDPQGSPRSTASWSRSNFVWLRDTWPPLSPLTSDHKAEVKGPSSREARAKLRTSLKVRVVPPRARMVGQRAYVTVIAQINTCSSSSAESKDIIGWICSIYGSEHIEMLTSTD